MPRHLGKSLFLLMSLQGISLAAGPTDKHAGSRTYTNACAACHQASGQGIPTVFPPLAGSEWVTAKSPDLLLQVILRGLTGPITVKGDPYAEEMSSFGTLSDEDIAALATHLRSSWGHQGSAVTPAQVGAARQVSASRKKPWTATELKEKFGAP